MAATFRTVNISGDSHDLAAFKALGVTPPRTPDIRITHKAAMDEATTPTRATFGGLDTSGAAAIAQKPLPTSPFPQAVQVPEPTEKKPSPPREESQHSTKSRESEDVEMNDSDGEDGAGDDGGSDEESVNADGTKSKSKKKSQRFYCTDYPPCNLSFTRSEHLARHIRKHTGERPFQCHCSRRFSRLDNLRQHAQTVHVNEEIPMNSLAATATSQRLVRQVRQDRVRPNGRARASTAGSTGPPVRGHSKSLSTSSITSIGSLSSVGYGPRDEGARRRPPPLVMADPRHSARLSLESYRSAADPQFSYRPASPSDFSTPTSATFSTGQNSPRWGSGVASPTSSHSRAQSMYVTGSRTPGRRLSVPSGGNPFQSPGSALARPLYTPGAFNSSNSGAFSPAAPGSIIPSPTTSSASGWSRRESATGDEAWRRRTWHPETREYSAGGSRLSHVITPGQYQTAAAQAPPPLAMVANNPDNQQQVRLPGIASFDPIPRGPVTPPRRIPSPMAVDSEAAAISALAAPKTMLPAADSIGEDRFKPQWDMGLHRGLTRLEINTPPRDNVGSWAENVGAAVQTRAEPPRVQPTVRFDTQTTVVSIPSITAPTIIGGMARGHHHTMSAPSIATSRESKRHGWYHGPSMAHAGIREVAEPRGPHVDRMIHPNLANGFVGFPARETRATADEPTPEVKMETVRSTSRPEAMSGFDALVAVAAATSEGSTAAAY